MPLKCEIRNEAHSMFDNRLDGHGMRFGSSVKPPQSVITWPKQVFILPTNDLTSGVASVKQRAPHRLSLGNNNQSQLSAGKRLVGLSLGMSGGIPPVSRPTDSVPLEKARPKARKPPLPFHKFRSAAYLSTDNGVEDKAGEAPTVRVPVAVCC